MKSKPKSPKFIDGDVVDVSFGGRGVIKSDGKVFFVEQALPGDRLKILVSKEKKSFGEGTITETLNENPQRISSPCSYSESCGSCQWLEAKKENQHQWKRNFIDTAIRKTAKLDQKVDAFFASPTQFSYRNRVSLKGRLRQGKIRLGYYKRKSHELIDVDKCLIVDEHINSLIDKIKSIHIEGEDKLKFDLDLQVVEDSELIVQILYPARASQKTVVRLAKAIEVLPNVLNVSLQKGDSKKVYKFDEQFGIQYYTYQGQFQQVNLPANHILREHVKDLVDQLAPKSVMDLFCGSGNLSLHLSEPGRKIIGVELNSSSIATAKINVEKNHLENIEFTCSSSKDFLRDPQNREFKPDLVIVDPPRRGMDEAIDDLISLDPDNILYISCDPNTLARDIRSLVDAGYKLDRLQGYDFFPQTYHVESLALLSKI